MVDTQIPTRNDQTNPFDSVFKSAFAVYVTRVKSFTDVSYGSVNFYDTILETAFKIEVQDSVDMFFRTAKVWFFDRYAIREILPLTGNEIITIKYKNMAAPSADANKVYHFSIQSISEVPNMSEYNKGSNITLMNLVEAPAFQFFTNNCIYKSYPWDEKKKVSDLINDVLIATPGLTNWYDIDIEETMNSEGAKFKFFIPNWTPMKTINYLKKYAISQADNFPYYTLFVDYPDKEGAKPKIRCKPVYKYMSDKGSHLFSSHFQQQTYRPAQGNTGQPALEYEKENNFEIFNVFTSRQFDYFQRAKTAFAQLSGETFYTFDYVDDNKFYALDYKFIQDSYQGLGQKQLHNMNYGNMWASQRPHSFTDPLRLLNMKRNEFAYNTIHSGIACTMEMPINAHRHAGHLADCIFKNSMDQQGGVDYMMSGLWMIWSQIDQIQDGVARSKVMCIKDGFETFSINKEAGGLQSMVHLNPPKEISKVNSQPR